MTTSTPSTPKKLLATALPVSPDVATNTVVFLSEFLEKYPKQRLKKRAPTSLKARVGP